MRLAARIAKLEAKIPPPVPGCDRCRGHYVWCDQELTRVEINGVKVPACGACGTVLRRQVKVIFGIDPGAL